MILNFRDTTQATGGGKATNLGELQRAGLPVPEGFTVSAEVYREAVAHLDLPALLAQGPSAVRDAIEGAPLPAGLEEQVAERLAAWQESAGEHVEESADRATAPSDPALAVRSSATAEDLPEASFAGQQDSFLGVRGTAGVLAAIRRCWASLWTDRAVAYRERQGFDHAEVALAVVVQRLVDAEVAGVLFTRDPVSGAPDTLIDASWGLGESVVSGAVTPDEVRVRQGQVAQYTVGAKETRIDRDTTVGSGAETITRPVAPERRAARCLTDQQALELTDLGARVRAHFGQDMDVEWALEGEAFWLVQARPLTTGSPAQDAPSPHTASGKRISRLSRTFHDDLVEHYPGPYPLDVAAVTRMHRTLQQGMARIGVHSTPIEELLDVAADGTVRVAHPDVRVGAGTARLLTYRSPDPAGWPQVEAQFRDDLAAASPADPTALDTGALIAALDAVLDVVDRIALSRFLDYVGPAQLTAARLTALLALARRRDLDPYDLLGELPYVTALVDAQLRELATLDPTGTEFARRREEFLAQFGARTTKLYLPFSHRSWREDPAALDATLAALRRSRPRTLSPVPHAQVVLEVQRRLPRPLRGAFTRTVRRWRDGHIAREASVYLIEEAYIQARRVTDEMARRLVTVGALPDAGHLRFLTLEQVHDALRGTLEARACLALVERRAQARPRAALAWWQRPEEGSASGRRAPGGGGTSGGGRSTTRGRTSDTADGGHTGPEALVRGVAGSPGQAVGPVRVVAGPQDFDRLQPGDVLVCRYTDPSWTPLFSLASAVVTDTGGRLSHAAIVAREYGIPAVMGTGTATSSLSDGQDVRVDGSAGTVTAAGEASKARGNAVKG